MGVDTAPGDGTQTPRRLFALMDKFGAIIYTNKHIAQKSLCETALFYKCLYHHQLQRVHHRRFYLICTYTRIGE